MLEYLVRLNIGGKIIICNKFKATNKIIGEKSIPEVEGITFLIGLYSGSQISSININIG